MRYLMKLNELLNFPTFYNQVKTYRLPFKTAHKLAKLSTAIESEIAFYREKMMELIETYAQTDENGEYVYINNGQSIALKPETQEECQAKIVELETMEVELPDIKFLPEEFDQTTLTIEELYPILPFIEE